MCYCCAHDDMRSWLFSHDDIKLVYFTLFNLAYHYIIHIIIQQMHTITCNIMSQISRCALKMFTKTKKFIRCEIYECILHNIQQIFWKELPHRHLLSSLEGTNSYLHLILLLLIKIIQNAAILRGWNQN